MEIQVLHITRAYQSTPLSAGWSCSALSKTQPNPQGVKHKREWPWMIWQRKIQTTKSSTSPGMNDNFQILYSQKNLRNELIKIFVLISVGLLKPRMCVFSSSHIEKFMLAWPKTAVLYCTAMLPKWLRRRKWPGFLRTFSVIATSDWPRSQHKKAFRSSHHKRSWTLKV